MLAVERDQEAPARTDKAKVRDALEATRGYVGTGGVVNMSASDHMGLDLSAFRMLEVKNGNWALVKYASATERRPRMSAQWLQYLLSGLTVGAIYALVALGFSIIYNASRVINFAQGEFVMIGGMSAVTLVGAGLPLPLAVPARGAGGGRRSACAGEVRGRAGAPRSAR